MRKQSALLFLVVVFITACLSGCGSEQASEKTKVRFMTDVIAGGDAAALKKIVKDVNDTSKDFEIVLESIPGGHTDFDARLQTLLASGKGPDLFTITQEWVPRYAKNGALYDLTEMAKKSDAEQAKIDNYFDLATMDDKWNGKLWGYPEYIGTRVVYYNKDIFDEMKVPYPQPGWTWEQAYEMAKKLRNPAKQIWGGDISDKWNVCWAYGVDPMQGDGKSPVDSKEYAEAMAFCYKWARDENAVPSKAERDKFGNDPFASGHIAMKFESPYDPVEKKAKFKVGVVSMPSGPAGAINFAMEHSLVMNAKTAKPEVAYKAMLALLAAMHRNLISTPLKSQATRENLEKLLPPEKKYMVDVILSSIPLGRHFNCSPYQSDWYRAWESSCLAPFDNKKMAPTVENIMAVGKQARPRLEKILAGNLQDK